MENRNSDQNNNRSFFLRYSKFGLAGLGLLSYILFVSGDYFLPVKSPLWLLGALGLLVLLALGRLYLLYRPTGQTVLGWLKNNWPGLFLLGAIAVSSILSWQAIKTASVTPVEQDFAGQALAILSRSDWKPKNFAQPPLYLYLAAFVGELQFAQQAGAGKLTSPDGLTANGLIEAMRYVNLLVGLLTLLPVYATARLLWSAKIGAVAAGLVATSWLAYHSVASLQTGTLAGLLAATTLYFITSAYRSEGDKKAAFAWAGFALGLTMAAAYGGICLVLPLGLAVLWQSEAKLKKVGLSLLGLVGGFTLAAPGWILSFNLFADGLAGIGRAPENAAASYLKQSLASDGGLVILFVLTFLVGCRLGEREEVGKLWLMLSFPLAYLVIVALCGPVQLERLALIIPALAIAATQPLAIAAKFVQRKLDEHDDRHKWGESALLIGLVVTVALSSILLRRFLG